MDKLAINHSRTLLLLLLSIAQLTITPACHAVEVLRPIGPTEYRVVEGNNIEDARRKLAPFQLCLLCKCCASGGATMCATMSCCFGIDCQLPNKPFGVCAFVPKTCNCTSCAA